MRKKIDPYKVQAIELKKLKKKKSLSPDELKNLRKEKGLCVICGLEPPLESFDYCEHCVDKLQGQHYDDQLKDKAARRKARSKLDIRRRRENISTELRECLDNQAEITKKMSVAVMTLRPDQLPELKDEMLDNDVEIEKRLYGSDLLEWVLGEIDGEP